MSASGTESKAAIRKSSIWGIAIQCGAGDGVMILPSEIKKTRESIAEDSIGTYFATVLDQGVVRAEGDLSAYLRYDGLDLMIALAMGATAGAPAQQGATGAYAQSFKLANSLDGLMATLAVDNEVNVDECPSVKVAGITIRGEVGRPLEIAFHLIANDRITGSSTNTHQSMDSVTYFETANRALFSQAVFRMNAQSGSALSDSDRVYPSAFTLRLDRKLKGFHTLGTDANTIDEPSNDGQPECTLSLTFPRYTGATHFSDWDAATQKKLDIALTGTTIESSYKRTLKIMLPNLAYKGAELPMRRGVLEHPVEFNCLSCASAPAGMSNVTMPFQIDVINRQSGDVLG